MKKILIILIIPIIIIVFMVLTGCDNSSNQVFDFSKELLPEEINIEKATESGYLLKDDSVLIKEDKIVGIIEMTFIYEKEDKEVSAYLAILNPFYRDHNEFITDKYDLAKEEAEEYRQLLYEEDNNLIWIKGQIGNEYIDKYFEKDGLYIIEVEKNIQGEDGIIDYLNEIAEEYKALVIEQEEYECECE